MATTIDARGLSCPQPVLLTMSRIKELSSGELDILVDNEASRENVIRAASSQGWRVLKSEAQGEDFIVCIRK
jgi:tRNA 2-thiouridine synthesizing protein A